MIWLTTGMALMVVLLIVVAACWSRGLVRLDRELRERAHRATLLQSHDLVDAGPTGSVATSAHPGAG